MEIYDQLKKELESGKKSIAALKKIMRNKKVNEKYHDSYIRMLINDSNVHKTLRGWFCKTMYFELKSKKTSVKIKNPASWVGVCPSLPPQGKTLMIMMSNNIWLPHPRKYLDLRELDSLRKLMLSVDGEKKYKQEPNFTEEFCEDWKNWKSFNAISGDPDFQKEFREVALGFDYAKYLNKTYYNEVPKSGYSVEESLHDEKSLRDNECPESCGE